MYLLTLIVIHHFYPDSEIRSYIPLMPYLDVETQGQLDEFPRDGPTGLPPSPLPLCQANGASTLDQRMTSTSPNGRQCADSYGSFQQSVAQTKRHTQDGVAGTFTRPQPNQKHLEVNEKPNIKALPTSKFGRTQACYLVLLE
ncbi:hypothetical protein O181_013048 [Austropuccinia psidii MF-1]|uniref:Uncharacterized protein n=1 Tax=Austropuccinia psidii MF-1 TaxID=1389203 RepID=A0A9Q3GMR4_9BASI|nr:hypothetical protein [Austropuccinia psidii MF-1]